MISVSVFFAISKVKEEKRALIFDKQSLGSFRESPGIRFVVESRK